MYITFLFVTTLLLTFTLLPLWQNEAWWVRSLEFPRLQLFLMILFLLTLKLWLLDISSLQAWMLIFISFSCLIYQAWWIIPYTKLFPSEVKSTQVVDKLEKISIMTANVLTPNSNAKGLIDLVQDIEPDILVTLESDKWWQVQLGILEKNYPYTMKCPLDNLYGMHVYSKLPMINSQIKFLVQPDIPSMHALFKLASGLNVRIHFLHPTPPSPTENPTSSERDAELIIIAKNAAESDVPVIVTGDLNDVAWSETTRLFRKISGLLDPRVGRGMFNTFHAGHWYLRWPLDHLFHSKHFTLNRIKRLKGFGSDHFPLFTELVYEAEQNLHQNGLNADSEDITRAEEKESKLKVSKNDVPQPEKA